MKRTLTVVFALLMVAALNLSAQSLGDAARKQKSAKPKAQSSKVYTNDDMPSVGAEAVEPESEASAEKQESPKAEKKDSAGDQQKKLEAEWRGKIQDQKKKIADLEREADLLDREFKLRAAAFYADAGVRLRDDRKFADEQRKYEADMADRKKKIEEGKAQLEELQERARKAGVPRAAD